MIFFSMKQEGTAREFVEDFLYRAVGYNNLYKLKWQCNEITS